MYKYGMFVEDKYVGVSIYLNTWAWNKIQVLDYYQIEEEVHDDEIILMKSKQRKVKTCGNLE